jgi:hypothetical protein
MNKNLYILSRYLVDRGTKVNGIVFESIPYEDQYYMLPYLWKHFEYSGYFTDEENLKEDLEGWLERYENVTIKF